MSTTYCVYILANRSRNLYTGMSNNLERRLIEHRQELIPGFTSRYRIFRLVHFELFGDVRDAIAREKEIKGWRREKKIRLIESHNSTWADLADHLPAKHKKADPSYHSPTPGERVRDDHQTPARTLDPATRQPVIPNRPKSQFDPAPTPSPTSHKADAGEGPAVPFLLLCHPEPGRALRDRREGPAFFAAMTRAPEHLPRYPTPAILRKEPPSDCRQQWDTHFSCPPFAIINSQKHLAPLPW